ncbi:MAG TPA: DinB family protein [Candidatus Sulfotelmatobacter sp.]|nr:DinB family protein [Candidatus Sulfotelmatobacter sp.]
MSDLSQTICAAFVNEFQSHAASLHKWVAPLSNEQFWTNPFSYGNSVGHLILHLTGNLSYYIGARIAATGYVRNRDLEFTEASRPSKAQVLRNFDDTIAMVISTLQQQSPSDWTLSYSAERLHDAPNRVAAFLHCATHLYHHIGQINFLSRELTKP